jgi:hypothetical protein
MRTVRNGSAANAGAEQINARPVSSSARRVVVVMSGWTSIGWKQPDECRKCAA